MPRANPFRQTVVFANRKTLVPSELSYERVRTHLFVREPRRKAAPKAGIDAPEDHSKQREIFR